MVDCVTDSNRRFSYHNHMYNAARNVRCHFCRKYERFDCLRKKSNIDDIGLTDKSRYDSFKFTGNHRFYSPISFFFISFSLLKRSPFSLTPYLIWSWSHKFLWEFTGSDILQEIYGIMTIQFKGVAIVTGGGGELICILHRSRCRNARKFLPRTWICTYTIFKKIKKRRCSYQDQCLF